MELINHRPPPLTLTSRSSVLYFGKHHRKPPLISVSSLLVVRHCTSKQRMSEMRTKPPPLVNRHSEIQSRSLTIGDAIARNVRITSTPNNLRFVLVQTRGSFSHPQSEEKQEEEEPEESFEEIRIPKSYIDRMLKLGFTNFKSYPSYKVLLML
ncbi:hypothetical protein L1987_24787 [Smallanthus sonchifolius]|uniref:Uncharacterized protein n=1 Tax=Smallanthus sonchifolius TaxID=185202 RepID=A0ACB9IMV8_9ASTR|nr:hypothetical protein L1987_24787 [Smallanthus sonchifolius]